MEMRSAKQVVVRSEANGGEARSWWDEVRSWWKLDQKQVVARSEASGGEVRSWQT
jgi:prephenate dehydrogenase